MCSQLPSSLSTASRTSMEGDRAHVPTHRHSTNLRADPNAICGSKQRMHVDVFRQGPTLDQLPVEALVLPHRERQKLAALSPLVCNPLLGHQGFDSLGGCTLTHARDRCEEFAFTCLRVARPTIPYTNQMPKPNMNHRQRKQPIPLGWNAEYAVRIDDAYLVALRVMGWALGRYDWQVWGKPLMGRSQQS